MKIRKCLVLFVLLFAFSTVVEARSLFNWNHRRSGEQNAQLLIKDVKGMSDEYKKLFSDAVGWAVFPSISKGGIGIGGAAGNGRVYRKGVFIGTTTMSQLSIGFQFGGQVYGEIIFFQNDSVLNKFKEGKAELGANASVVVANAGAGATAGFKDGTIVLIVGGEGLMYEATISGQKFTFKGK